MLTFVLNLSSAPQTLYAQTSNMNFVYTKKNVTRTVLTFYLIFKR
jgi:hypothetical protein